ncbi:MAG TPA: HAMP domain-containing sensor histidine kinase, partial [Gemmatimonadaceae bacterium]|nr:HAMP domain-containing sensor histidine kinase [Gemmatimonadaceae bacterium]
TPFYLALYAAETRGARRAVAVRLLDAVPPADRLSRPLAARVVRETGGAGFVFWLPTDSTRPRDAQPLLDRSRVLAYAQPAPITQGAMRVRTLERARLVAAATLALAMACFMVGTWRVGRKFRWRLVAVGVALLCTATAPLNAFSNYSRLFDASLYFTGTGGPLTANAGALLITGVLTLLALLAGIRRLSRGAPRLLWAGVVLAIAALGPFLLRDLARGIQIPAYGVNTALWLIWEVPIFLAACALLLAGAGAGSAALGGVRGLPAWVGPVLAGLAALLGPVTWEASGGWPWWYPIPWIVAIAALALARRSRTLVSSAAMVAALGATTLVWGATTRGRMALAERDVRGLSETDPYAVTLAERFGGAVLSSGPQTPSREWLLRLYATSELAAGGYPSWFSVWRGDTVPATTLRTAAFEVPGDQVREIVRQAQATRQIIELPLLARPAVEVALAVPTDSGVVVAVVASRTRLISGDPFAKLLGIEQPPEAQPPYVLQLGDYPAHVPAGPQQVEWRREATALHGDWVARTGIGASRVHVEVELRSVPALVQRGVLIVLLDLAIVWALWLGSVLADGAVMRWLRERERRWRRSYRTQLTLALFAFFMIPALAFAVWSYRQLADDAAQSRELLVRETLRAVAPGRQATEWLSSESRRLQAPLFLYHGGALVSASDTLLSALAPTGRLLDPPVHVALALQDEVTAISDESFGVAHALFGFRAIETEQGNDVLAAPARSDEAILDPRRSDLAVLVLFATALGALAAFWLSGIAARQLARPIGSLRKAALTLAAGGRAPVLEDNPTAEFRPVFAAFRRMATELEASKAATAHAQRVLAWGEMARQVAHEIKNPLTPIRLGVQHLKRARADQRVDFDRVLDENVTRILAEIDHLDEIARAFSRYGAGPSDRPNAEPTDVSDVLRDLVGLERMGDETIRWQLEGADERVQALARADELREVLLNLYENARLAGARAIGTTLSTDSVVRIVVQDDGQGIPADILPRVFEPHFSTRTSGSGLGLAISRRLIEAWGGRIWLQSAPGEGTRVQIELPRAG